MISAALWLLLAYLIGAIPTSYLAARLGAGIDLREHGSRNLGATNLYRVLGWKYALPVGVFDVLKGTVPVLILAPRLGTDDWIPIAVGAAAILGHVYPVYLGFKGGKGVATAAGVMVAIAPLVFLISALVWVVLLASVRIMSVASVAGAAVFPLATWWLAPDNSALLASGIVLAAFITFTHRANIRRLIAGTEPKLGGRQPGQGNGSGMGAGAGAGAKT